MSINIIDKYLEDEFSSNDRIQIIATIGNFIFGRSDGSLVFATKSLQSDPKISTLGQIVIRTCADYELEEELDKYSTVSFLSEERDELEIFIAACTMYMSKEYERDTHFINFFESISDIFTKKVIKNSDFLGLYGELLFIRDTFEKTGVNISKYYQGSSKHLIDFKIDGKLFEVKTTLKNNRIHRINNDQLSNKGWLVSILLSESNYGKSFEDVYSDIKELLSEELNIFVLAVIANLKREQRELKLQSDDETVKIFDFESLPKIENAVESISNIKFDLDLSNIECKSIIDILVFS